MLETSIFSFSHSVLYLSPKTNFNYLVTFILSPANVFNFDQPKNMLFGEEFTGEVLLEVLEANDIKPLPKSTK